VSLLPGYSSLGLPVGLAVGLLLGTVNGALIAYLKLPPFIVTLGTLTAMRGAAYLLAGGSTVMNAELSFAWVGNDNLGPVPWLAIIALAVVASSWFVLRRTVFGTYVYAVGGSEQAARLTGIDVPRVLLGVYAISGVLAGLGAVMAASRLFSADGHLGTGYELDAIAAVILGGTSFVGGIGGVVGTLLGALIIATLNNGLTLLDVSEFWQLVIKGAVIVLAVLLDRYRLKV
jgi:ribose transport system permease protein